MIMQAEANKIYTPEEYLEREVESAIRHEYRSGEIIPMTGGTPNHNDIAGNLYILLKSSLKGKAYRTFYADQRLWIPGANLLECHTATRIVQLFDTVKTIPAVTHDFTSLGHIT